MSSDFTTDSTAFNGANNTGLAPLFLKACANNNNLLICPYPLEHAIKAIVFTFII